MDFLKGLYLVLSATATLFAAGAGMVFSQNRCGTMDYWEQQKNRNPRLEEQFRQMNEQIRLFTLQQGALKQQQAVITVPVVVHVLYSTAGQNISDAQILSQMDVLNEDYRRLNTDTANTPSWFKGVAADCEIEFCLAARDPFDNPTTGIIRKSTTHGPFNGNGDEKSNATGGSNPWPSDRYLNIWVCDLSLCCLGYATFPGGPAAEDGVVIHYTNFGRTGNVQAPFHKGRTGSHEIGHWLGLLHSFQGGCAGTSATTCNSQGDNVCDTPPTSTANYGCPPLTQNTCTETPTDMNDMHMNYLDYTDDPCMNLFSQGQRTRMRAVLNGARLSIQSSNGCVPVVLQANDAGIALILSPSDTLCATTVAPVVRLKNNGSATLTSVAINFSIDGGPVNVFNWTGSLPSLQTIDVTLPLQTISAGAHTLNAFTGNPNGAADGDTTNDASVQSFTIVTVAGLPLPHTQDIEAVTFPPAGWKVINPNNNATWTRDTVGGYGASAASARMYFFSSAENIAGQVDFFNSPEFSLTGIMAPVNLTFDLAYARYDSAYFDSLFISASTDCGNSWTTLWKDGNASMATAPDDTSSFIPAPNQWRTDTVGLDAYSGMSDLTLRFEARSYWGNNLYIDNINLTGTAVTAPPVAGFGSGATSVCAGGSVSFFDQSTNGPNSWNWDFPGGTPSTSTQKDPVISYAAPGLYDVTLNVSNIVGSDTKMMSGYLTVLPLPQAAVSVKAARCAGQCDGSASLAVSGGTAPYTYQWSSGATASTAGALCAGSYTFTVTDGQGCKSVPGSVSVSEPPALVVVPVVTPAQCGGVCNGSITLSVSGGTKPYIYKWSTGSTGSTASSLCAGAYFATVTDTNGCTTVESILIVNGSSLGTNVSTVASTCGNADGSASVSVTGGTPPYSYLWSNGAASSAPGGLVAGSYLVTVTDAGGCTASAQALISDQGAPSASVSAVTSAGPCKGDCSGTATLTASGGTAPYTYSWSNGQTGFFASNLCAGNYSVKVSGSDGCTAAAAATITEPVALTLSATAFPVSAAGACDGIAQAFTFGGTPPYTYAWSDSAGQSTPSSTALCAGTYSVTVTDSSGCISVTTALVEAPSGFASHAPAVDRLRLYPNPNTGRFTVEYSGKESIYLLKIYNTLGKVMVNRRWEVVDGRVEIDLSSAPSGLYCVEVIGKGGIERSRFVVW